MISRSVTDLYKLSGTQGSGGFLLWSCQWPSQLTCLEYSTLMATYKSPKHMFCLYYTVYNTFVDGYIKLSLAIMCILASTLVETSAAELDQVKVLFSFVICIVVVTPAVVAFGFLCQVLWRKHFGVAQSNGTRMMVAQRFREVMTLGCHLSNAQFTKLITHKLADTIVSNFVAFLMCLWRQS